MFRLWLKFAAVGMIGWAIVTAVRAEEPKILPPVTVDAPPRSPLLPNPVAAAVPSTAIAEGGGQPSGGPGSGKHERCVDVTIGNDTSFGCINQRLRRKVDEVNPVLNLPPIDARSSDLKVGTVNIPAVRQQYGSSFGHSVVPFRPNTVYTPTIGRR